LALSGGGYRGLFTAHVLELIEVSTNARVRDRFDLIAGTSAGALIAAGLAHGIPAARIRETFERHGPRIFPQHGVRTQAKRLVSAPYDAERLSDVLDEVFADNVAALDTPIAEQPIRLLVTAISAREHRARVYGGKGLGDDIHPKISLREAILSSAAAPTYFPIRDATDAEPLVDGGLVANDPALVALTYARRRYAVDFNELFVLGIGTASPDPAIVKEGRLKRGAGGWLFSIDRSLVLMTLNAQEELSRRLVENLLADHYVRIDATPSPDEARFLKLDLASPRSTQVLKKLAAEAAAAALRKRSVRAFF
jgi:patatin-like phospholipase/acyl hydrolase